MPVYEYRCLDRKQEFERLRPLRERAADEVPRPECGGSRVEKRWSYVFAVTSKKSSGWQSWSDSVRPTRNRRLSRGSKNRMKMPRILPLLVALAVLLPAPAA
ncbi:MAG: zinc ribbon domain-containing protein, partial [Acidobacteriota bacterium]|nr:zinc ribbon domain-containing protein [Acidobacteriota bacterium]